MRFPTTRWIALNSPCRHLYLVGVAKRQSNNIQQAILLIRHEIQSHLDSLNHNLKRSQELSDEVGEAQRNPGGDLSNLARQSKLLAINGLIEAAHAHGFGDPFGVVASEMKKLSLDTTRAAADIGIKIGRLSSKMAEQLVTVKTAILTVQESATRLQSIVQDIALAEERFNSSSDELKGAIGDIHANNTDVVSQLTGFGQSPIPGCRLSASGSGRESPPGAWRACPVDGREHLRSVLDCVCSIRRSWSAWTTKCQPMSWLVSVTLMPL